MIYAPCCYAAPPPQVDPLDAFMAEIGQMETTAPAKPRSERVEEEDHVTDFVKARREGRSAYAEPRSGRRRAGRVCCLICERALPGLQAAF